MTIKEISISRGRKYSQNYQSVDYHVSITVDGEDLEEMKGEARLGLASIEMMEQERCRDVLLINGYEEEGKGEISVNPSKSPSMATEEVNTSQMGTDSKPLPVIAEVDPLSDEVEYDGKTFGKFVPCKYKCGMFTAWGKPYKQGDKKLHLNPMTKEVLGYDCPAFGGGS